MKKNESIFGQKRPGVGRDLKFTNVTEGNTNEKTYERKDENYITVSFYAGYKKFYPTVTTY